MTPEERADRARALLDDPVLREAFNTVRETYRDLIEETPVSDDKALLDIRKMLHLLRDVEQHVQQAAESGSLILQSHEQEKHPFLGDVRSLWQRKQ